MTKNKKKVKKAVARRFKVTKTGKVMHARQNSGHRKTHKTKRQIRRGKEPKALHKTSAKRIKRLLNKE